MENKRRVEFKIEVKFFEDIFYVYYVKVFLEDISFFFGVKRIGGTLQFRGSAYFFALTAVQNGAINMLPLCHIPHIC